MNGILQPLRCLTAPSPRRDCALLCAVRPALLFAGLLASGSAFAAVSDSTYTNANLRASTARPWIPAVPVPAAAPWATALRLPLTIVSYPLVLFGKSAERGMIYSEENALMPRAAVALRASSQHGLLLAPAILGEGAGFGAVIGWTPPALGRHLVASASATTRGYDGVRLATAAGPVSAAYEFQWRPREGYFGAGIQAPSSGESAFGMSVQSLQMGASWRWYHAAATKLAARAGGAPPEGAVAADALRGTRLSCWAGPRAALVTGGRDPERPSFEQLHPVEAAQSLAHVAEHLVYGIGLAHDARSGAPHWTRGWRAAVDAERFDESLTGLALMDAHSDQPSFTRVNYQGEVGESFGRDPRTVRLVVEVLDQIPDQGSGPLAIPDLVSLGGARLAGFEPGRFHDVDRMIAKLSYIFPLGKNLELDLHSEAGSVYPSLGVARLRSFEHSFGTELRLRGDVVMLGALGIDWSDEAIRVRLSVGGVE